MNAMSALMIDNRDKRIVEYQNKVHQLRAENARLRKALEAFDNCGLICTDGKSMESADVHPELLAALEGARAALSERA